MKATVRSDWSLGSIVRFSWNRLPGLIAGFSLIAGFGLAVPVTALAQGTAGTAASQPPSDQTAQAGEALEEVVVTARYKTENLQNVPETVSAVTGNQLQDLDLLNMTDLTAVVPGLQIINSGTGFSDSDTLRGLTFNPITGTQNIAAFYVNDALVTNDFITYANYDIGQIEVLEGPQGTLRGEPSPAGALSVTTHPANLEQYGGSGTVTGSDLGLFNAQGAVNLPIVADKFAVRLSGLIDKEPGSDVLSVNDPMRPYQHTYSERVSFAFQPIDTLTANLMYQHLTNDTAGYEDEFGTGSPGGVFSGPAGYIPTVIPPNYNGPPLGQYARRSADSGPFLQDSKTDIGTANINWRFAGQQLTYVGGWWKYGLLNLQGEGSAGDQVPAINPNNRTPTRGDLPFSTQVEQIQELRLASNAPDRFWDYTTGVFYREATDVVDDVIPITIGFPYGNPPDPYTFHPADSLLALLNSPKVEAEFSTFAHLTFHLADRTEVTAGARYIDYNASGYTIGKLTIGNFVATIEPYTPENLVQRAWIYEASISHKFTDNLLAYANSGSSSLPGSTAVGITNGGDNAELASLTKTKVETSYSFELGVKSTWLDNRVRMNVDVFHQTYDRLVYYGLPTYYIVNNGVNPPTVGAFSFTSNPNAVVNGVELDAGFIPVKNWTIDLKSSFVHGHLTGSDVPCNPPGPVPTIASFPAGTDIFLCPGHFSTQTGPNFNASAQSQYVYSLTGSLQAFVRGLLSFYGRNPNGSEPPQNYTVPSYLNLDLYLGLRAPNGAWQAMLYTKNALNKTTILNLSTVTPIGGLPTPGGTNPASLFGPSGYYGIGLSNREEYGLTLQYAFGSR